MNYMFEKNNYLFVVIIERMVKEDDLIPKKE